jgi:DNA/RNA-binding domain of Phe-tRNA-synthetase-like protein
MFTVSDEWKATYPGASAGVLCMDNVANPKAHPGLDGRKKELEAQLRALYAGFDRPALRDLPQMQAYHTFYKTFKKTYHVQLQLESVVLKGKPIPQVAALVESMFMAELQDLLLTAGHDLDKVRPPVGIDVAGGTERFVQITGQGQQLKPGDMMIADALGIISSVIYGPDRRTQIEAGTTRVMFTTYAPPGIDSEAVRGHLAHIRDNVHLVAPQAGTTMLEVYSAGY